jgi:hypothetical protein
VFGQANRFPHYLCVQHQSRGEYTPRCNREKQDYIFIVLKSVAMK